MRTTHTSIIQAIVAANFMADAAQVERLAGAVVEGQQADGTYLRVLLAHMQAKLGKATRRRRTGADVKAGETVLDSIHADLYAHVLKGVGPDELDTNERNRRATFARSAASTVRFFIRGGGDVRTVDVTTVTKAGLRKAVQPQGTPAPENETRAERTFRKATDALVRAAQRLLAREGPDEVRERLDAAMDQLEALLESLPAQEGQQQQAADFGGQTTTIVAGRPGAGGGRGAPAGAILHRPAGG